MSPQAFPSVHTGDRERQNQFARAVHARLGVASAVAAAGAWAVAVPLRGALVVSAGDARGVTLMGAAIVALACVLWVSSRIIVRKPVPLLAPGLFWSFALVVGAAANVLFETATAASLASLFCFLAIAFVALNQVTRMSGRGASAALSFFTIALVGEGLVLLFDRVLTHAPYAAVDFIGVMASAVVVMFAAPRISRLWRALHDAASSNALVDFAAMNVLALTQAAPALSPKPGPSATRAEPVAAALAVHTQEVRAMKDTIPTPEFEDQS